MENKDLFSRSIAAKPGNDWSVRYVSSYSATFYEAAEVNKNDYSGYYSSTRTCEMAMTEAVKKNYESILYLADECIS